MARLFKIVSILRCPTRIQDGFLYFGTVLSDIRRGPGLAQRAQKDLTERLKEIGYTDTNLRTQFTDLNGNRWDSAAALAARALRDSTDMSSKAACLLMR